MSKAAGPMKKPIREFIRYSQWKIPEVNCGIASMSEISLLENNIPVLPRAHPAEWGIPLLKEKLLFFLDKQPKRTPFIV